jgi:hypothetical protein
MHDLRRSKEGILDACGARRERTESDFTGVNSTCGVRDECSSDFTSERAVLVSGGPKSVKALRCSSVGCDELEDSPGHRSRNAWSSVRVHRKRARSGAIPRGIEILMIEICQIDRTMAAISHRAGVNG